VTAGFSQLPCYQQSGKKQTLSSFWACWWRFCHILWLCETLGCASVYMCQGLDGRKMITLRRPAESRSDNVSSAIIGGIFADFSHLWLTSNYSIQLKVLAVYVKKEILKTLGLLFRGCLSTVDCVMHNDSLVDLCVVSFMLWTGLVCQVCYDKLLSCLSESVLVNIFGSVLLERRLIFCARQFRYDLYYVLAAKKLVMLFFYSAVIMALLVQEFTVFIWWKCHKWRAAVDLPAA